MALIKYNNQSLSSITTLPSAVPTGKLKLISSQTASNSASISFTSGLTSTYKVYKFVFGDIHPRTDSVNFQFNLSSDAGANYNVTKTSTSFSTYHAESDAFAGLTYQPSLDLSQSTDYQPFSDVIGSDADQSHAGVLYLYNPASTTYVKHFIATFDMSQPSDYNQCSFTGGYGNTTSAVNAIRFQMSSGNFDGTIYLYAIDNS
jgi:hypothetical protein